MVQSEDGEFFSEQLTRSLGEWHPLQANQIRAEKDNIKYATDVLDDFINGGGHTMASPDSPSEWHLIGRIHRFFERQFDRKPGGEPEQRQQV